LVKPWPRFPTALPALLCMGVAVILAAPCLPANAQDTAYSGNKSWTDSVSSSVKQGFAKLGQTVSPSPSPTKVPSPVDNPISLQSKATPGPELYVAIAQLYQQAGKMDDAEQQYKLALADKEKPDNLAALLGYAQLKDSQGKSEEALQLYQRAAKAYPQQASVHNNVGLCYARQGRLDEAVAAMNHAVQLEPKNRLYRNNIASVLVDQNRIREAFTHLREAHGEAAAYYNLGYLLNKKGQTQAAMQQFAWALKTDPSMDAARRWLDYLQRTTTQARLPQHPAAMGVKIISGPATSTDATLQPSENPMPRRLPPTTLYDPHPDASVLPGISYEPSPALVAPLPPVPAGSRPGASFQVN
jgi:tetratricopeptide (TPR) repeat protein